MEEDKIVLPGDVIGEGEIKRAERGIVRVENNTRYAMVVGMIREGKFIPLEHVYIPKPGDPVVGIVVGERRPVGYVVDTNMYYPGLVLSREVRIRLPISTQIFAKVSRVEPGGNVILSDITKLPAGKIVDVPAAKIPRIIGKEGSMINTIKKKTGVSIYVGFNGYIWIGKKGNVAKAIKAIKAVVSKAHLRGLTDEIEKILEE